MAAAYATSRDLSFEEVLQLNQELDESWQELIVEVVDGQRNGFEITARVNAEELEGAVDLADREKLRRALIQQQTNAAYNAIKWRFTNATKAMSQDPDEYKQWIVLTRSGPIVRVFRRYKAGDANPVPIPEAFAAAVKSVTPRQGRSRREEPRLKEKTTSDRDAESRRRQRVVAEG